MADGNDAIEWDFVTLVARWNLFGLPALMLVVAIVVLVRRHLRPAATAWLDSARTVRLIGLIHSLLALQASIAMVQELIIHRAMGNPQSQPRLIGAVIGSVVNPLLAWGILLRRRLARWIAIGWYAVLAVTAIVVVAWLFHYQVAVDPSRWPEELVSKAMPFFLFAVMLLPRTRAIFADRARSNARGEEVSREAEAAAGEIPSAGWPIVSLVTRCFLLVVCSNLLIDVIDWLNRLVTEPDSAA